MHKQRNLVEKAPKELTEQIKTVVAQRLYAALNELKVDRTKTVQIMTLINNAIDESCTKYSRQFYKNVDDFVASLTEEPKKQSTKSK